MSYKKITGTFLDEITHDIASHNWGDEWMAEFDTMAEAGIDTVAVIRTGPDADLVVLDQNGFVEETIVAGESVYQREEES